MRNTLSALVRPGALVLGSLQVVLLLCLASAAPGQDRTQGYLGVELNDLTEADAEELGWDAPRGTRVVTVKPGTPAEEHGLEPDDILIALDGAEIADTSGFMRAIVGREAGTGIVLTLIRKGARLELSATLGQLHRRADRGEERAVVPIMEPFLRIETGRHMDRVWRISLSADGRLLATGSADKTVRLWSLPDGAPIRTLRVPIGTGGQGEIRAVALSPDGRFLAAGGWDAGYDRQGLYHIYIFDTVTGAIARRLPGQTEFVSHMAFSADGHYLAVGLHGEGGLRIWDTQSWTAVKHHPGTGATIYGLDFGPGGRLATTAWDGRVRLYDRSFNLIDDQDTPGGNFPYGIAFSPDGTKIAVAHSDSRVVDVLDAETLEPVQRFELISQDEGTFLAVDWSADGEHLYAAGSYRDPRGTHPVIRWSMSGPSAASSLAGPTDTILTIAARGKDGVVYGSADPAVGLIGEKTELVFYYGAKKIDMRGNRSHALAISDDAWQVALETDRPFRDYWLFDVATLRFKKLETEAEDFHVADYSSLDIRDWPDTYEPKVNGNPIAIDRHELSRSLAILPDRQNFILGGEWSLGRYDLEGNVVWRWSTPTIWGVNTSTDGRLIVAAQIDGTLRWYRASDGAELLALFIDPTEYPRRWVLWTPSGYYAASTGGEDLVGWHVNRAWNEAADFFSVSRFRTRYYRPDIVQTVLEVLDEGEAVRIANEKAERERESLEVEKLLPPVIEILNPEDGTSVTRRELVLEYKVRSPSGLPVTKLDVLIDGRPYKPGKARGGFNYSAGAAALKVDIPERDVEITLVAHTDASVSEAVSINIKWAGKVEDTASKPKLLALIVGISGYERSHLRLDWAAQDARDVEGALKDQKGRRFREVETRVLTDKEATLRAILEGFEWLERKTTAKDTAVIFLAGHGITTKKLRFYFLPVEGDPERPRSTALGGEVLVQFVNDVLGKVVMFIDACHSARGLEGPGPNQGAVDLSAVTNELASVENGAVMYAASTGRQLAIERDEWKNGAFTEALLEGYAGKADYTADDKISTDELGLWLRTRVKQLTGDEQEPVMLKSKAIREFEISSLR